jgi:hypothetical protein
MKIRLLILTILVCRYATGQELSNIGKSPLLQINGGLSVNQTFNWSDVPGSYRQPYAYTLMANLNFSVYGWSIPLSGMFSNRQWSYQQPFNQFSLNPSYKWIKIYLGYNSMAFSSYTMNGHRFYGGGVELTPNSSWKFSAMVGRMQERILPDSSGRIEPAFSRFGTGFKTEYSFKGGNVALSTFYARDDKNSLAGYDSLKITPAENLALGLSTNFSVLSHFNIGMEYSTSLFTEDARLARADGQYTLMPLYTKRNSTRQFQALKSNFAYNSPIGSIGVGYERVEPGYRTLGSYSTVNDFENYTLNYAGQIIPEKLNFAANIGLQNDDLENSKAQNNKRRVGSANIGFTPSQVVNISLNYGNFRNFTHVRSGFENINNTTPYQYADTLDYTQISETFGSAISITPKGTENVRRSIILSANYQKATEQQSDNANHANNNFLNGMIGYSHSMTKQNLSLSSGFNFNRNSADSIVSMMLGPSLSARKSFFEKKFNTNLSLAYNQNIMNSKAQSEVYIIRAGIGYVLKETHNFDFSAVFANRHNMVRSSTTNDIALTFTYRYNFKGVKVDLKKKAAQKSEN